jgi:hypothetical protein
MSIVFTANCNRTPLGVRWSFTRTRLVPRGVIFKRLTRERDAFTFAHGTAKECDRVE